MGYLVVINFEKNSQNSTFAKNQTFLRSNNAPKVQPELQNRKMFTHVAVFLLG
jgi:hypothetical protein